MPDIPNIPEALISKNGVEMNPPPGTLLPKVNSMIADAVRAIGEGKSGTLTVWIDTTMGVNAAVAQKVGDHVKIVGYFGKTWGQPIRAGIAGQVDW